MSSLPKNIISGLLCVLIVACGGGGGSDSPSSTIQASTQIASSASITPTASGSTAASPSPASGLPGNSGNTPPRTSTAPVTPAPTRASWHLVAGDLLVSGSADGAGPSSRFNVPTGIANDATGNLYVTDRGNRTIRKITSDGVVTTLAGNADAILGPPVDGSATDARFISPQGIAVNSAGDLFVSEMTNSHNQGLRRITANGVVTTPGSICCGLAIDNADSLYATNSIFNTIVKFPPGGPSIILAGAYTPPPFADGTGAAARFNNPSGIAVGPQGELYVADSRNHVIRKVTQAGIVTTIAGTPGIAGSADGEGPSASFNFPTALAIDSSGNLYVSDSENSTLRKITPSGSVTTIAIKPALIGAVRGMVFSGKKTLVVTVGHAVVKLLFDCRSCHD